MTISFTVPMIPTAKGRPRAFVRGGKVNVYTPAKTDQAERDFIALAAEHAPPVPLEGPLELTLVFVLPIPASWSKRKRASAGWHCSKPDLDNIVKLVSDSMNRSGAWWGDDSQIAYIRATKSYGNAPRIDIAITQITGGPV